MTDCFIHIQQHNGLGENVFLPFLSNTSVIPHISYLADFFKTSALFSLQKEHHVCFKHDLPFVFLILALGGFVHSLKDRTVHEVDRRLLLSDPQTIPVQLNADFKNTG